MSATAMNVDQVQMQRFHERLARIQKKGHKVELAPLGAVEFDDKGRARIERAPSMGGARVKRFFRSLVVSPFKLTLALVLGAVVVVATRYGRMFWDGGALTGDGAGPAMLMDAGIALCAVLFLRLVFRMRGRITLLGQLLGLAAGVLAMHNLVHVAPDLWLAAFPEAWVSDVLATTQPHSILIRGVSYVL